MQVKRCSVCLTPVRVELLVPVELQSGEVCFCHDCARSERGRRVLEAALETEAALLMTG